MLNRSVIVAGIAVAALSSVSSGAILVYNTTLSGPAEAPPNASPGTGTVTVTVDTTLNTMRVEASFSGLIGNVTVCHIHASLLMTPFTGTAGVATPTPTFPGFPAGVTAGSYDQTFDMSLVSSYNGAFITANGGTPLTAFAALLDTLDDGRAYFNLHTSAFTGGEIRGFLPTPGAASLFGFAALAAARRRR